MIDMGMPRNRAPRDGAEIKKHASLLFHLVIAVFQMLHSGLNLNPAVSFTPAAKATTRGHPWKMSKPQAVTRIRRNAFAVRAINKWNALPSHVVTSSMVNQFKARLNSHWTHLQYTIPHQD